MFKVKQIALILKYKSTNFNQVNIFMAKELMSFLIFKSQIKLELFEFFNIFKIIKIFKPYLSGLLILYPNIYSKSITI